MILIEGIDVKVANSEEAMYLPLLFSFSAMYPPLLLPSSSLLYVSYPTLPSSAMLPMYHSILFPSMYRPLLLPSSAMHPPLSLIRPIICVIYDMEGLHSSLPIIDVV